MRAHQPNDLPRPDGHLSLCCRFAACAANLHQLPNGMQQLISGLYLHHGRLTGHCASQVTMLCDAQSSSRCSRWQLHGWLQATAVPRSHNEGKHSDSTLVS